MTKRILWTVLLLGFFTAASAQAQNLTWTAGNVGGGWYTIGGGIANIINEKSGGITVKVIPGGGVQNPSLVDKGECELGWGLPFMNAAAANGEDPYTRKHESLRAIAGGMSLNYFHFFMGSESPYKTMDEIFGQKKPTRIALSTTGTSEEWVFRKVMAHYMTDYKALEAAGFKFFRGSYAEQASQFKDRNVDAVFTFLALPAAAVTEASVGRSLKVMPFSQGLLKSLSHYGIEGGVIKRGTYPKATNANEDVLTATAGSVIICNKSLPDDSAYRIAKAIHENLDAFRKVHGSLATYELKDAITGTGLPLHPGAAKYYKEKGILK
jgi:TRAP transporter TAXI family solute receptor